MKTFIGIIFFVSFLSFHQLGVCSLDTGIALKPNYTSINLNVSYKSIGGLQEPHSWFVERYYEFVNVIVDFILPDALPNELLNIGLGDVLFMNYGKLLWAYRRLIIFVIIVLIQIFFLIGSNVKMICSCLFFCTRWCNWRPPETTSKFRKWLWLVWVYTALAILLFMLVMAHQSNQNMDDGIGNVVVTLDDTIVDVELFVDTTLKQLEILLLNNLQDYLTFFINSGEKTTIEVLRDLEGILGSIDFSKIFEDIEENFNFIKPIFDEIEKVLGEVEDLGKTINKDIAGLKNMVENLICETAECEQLKKLIPSLESVYDGGSYLINGTFTDLENLAGLGEKELEGLGNLTYLIGGKAIEEGKALDNLTAKIAGNVVADLKIAGGGLANMTSAIGSEAIEEGKALDNLTAKIAGNVVADLEIAEGGLANMTSAIGSKAIEEGKALDNITAKIAGNVAEDLKIAEGGLANLTSAIGGEALQEGKAIGNLTAKVTGKVIEGLKDTGKGLTNLTKNIVGGLGNVAGGVGDEIKNEGKALKDLTKNVAGGIAGGIGDVAGGLKDEVGGLFGGLSKWTFGSGQKKEKAKDTKTTTEASKVVKTPNANATEKIVIKGLEKTGKGLTNLPKNIVGGLGNVAGGIGSEIKNEGKALKDLTGNVAGGVASGIGNVAGGIKNEVGGLLSWTFGSGDKKKKSKDTKPTNDNSEQEDNTLTTVSPVREDKKIEQITPKVRENVIIKDLKDTGKGLTNLTGNIVGGLENMAGGVGNQLKNEGKALKDLTGNVAGGVASGIGNVAGDLKNEVGGLLSWTFGSGDKKKKSKDNKSTNGTSKQEDKTVTTKSPIGEGKSIKQATPKVTENVIIKDLKDTGKGLTNLTGNIVGGLENMAGAVGNQLKNEGKDLTGNVAGGVASGIGNMTGGLKNEVGGLLSWTLGSKDKKNKDGDKKPTNTTQMINKEKTSTENTIAVMTTGKTSSSLPGKIVGGLENIAGGVGNELKNEGKALKDLTGNIAGGVTSGIGNVAGGIESEVGGLFKGLGGWTFGSGDKKEKPKPIEPIKTSKVTTEANIVTTKKGIQEKEKSIIKNEYTHVLTSSDNLVPKQEVQIDESSMDLTLDLKNIGNVNTGQTNSFNNIFAGLGNLASKVETGVQTSGNAITGKIGNTATGVKNEVSSNFGGLGSWSSNKKIKDVTIVSTTTAKIDIPTTPKIVKTKSQSGFGSFFGGIENLASGVTSGIKKGGSKLGGLASNVVGGVENTAGGVESKIGGLFGGWSSGGSSKTTIVTTVKPNVKTTTPKKVNSGFGSWFGGSSTSSKPSKVSSGIEKTATGVENKVSGASKKLLNMGDSFFGFRRKRALGLSFGDLKKDFNMIFGTIDRIENYVVNDLKHLNNITYIISPIIDEIDSILKTVLHEVEEELKEATKPLEKFFAATIDKIISVENSILNATHIIQGTQEMINWYEIYRYHISNFIAGALLLSFTVLTFGISVRMKCNNTITKFTYKGGFTFLHITALLMAVTSLIYIVIGVTSQKVLCETLDTNYREDNIMRLLSRINPAKYGLLLDINLHKVILRCHQDQSIYEVTALKSVMNIEKLALEFFDLDAIEKEFEPLFNMTMDFSKYLPLGTIHTIEDDLGFESFEKILDFPIFAQMEKLEEEFTHIPIIGPVIKTIAGKIVSFKDKIQSIQSPVQSANLGFPNLLSNIKKLLMDVENQLVEIEERSEKTLEDVATNFKNILLTSLKDYVYNRLIHSIEHEIGKCKPISAAFNSTLNSVCRRITTPANGHWFSWFTGVFLSIFLIVLSRYVDDKINRFKEVEKSDSPDESSKPVDEIEMKSFDNQKVEIDCEKTVTVTQSEEAL